MQKKRLIIATTNEGKICEIKEALKKLPFEVLSLKELRKQIKFPAEGSDYHKNACSKANTLSEYFNMPSIADDSGLEVDYLDSNPGPFSARFGGTNITDSKRNNLLLAKLKGVPNSERTARFRCVIALSIPGEKCKTVEATCEGFITEHPSGHNGFGYDPIFFVPELGKTFAEVDNKLKTQISHRGKALIKLRKLLKKLSTDKKN